MLLFLHDPQKYSIATHVCAALCLFVNLFYFPEYSIYFALDALALCWWHLGDGKNLATLIMEQGSAALKKKSSLVLIHLTPFAWRSGQTSSMLGGAQFKATLLTVKHLPAMYNAK